MLNGFTVGVLSMKKSWGSVFITMWIDNPVNCIPKNFIVYFMCCCCFLTTFKTNKNLTGDYDRESRRVLWVLIPSTFPSLSGHLCFLTILVPQASVKEVDVFSYASSSLPRSIPEGNLIPVAALFSWDNRIPVCTVQLRTCPWVTLQRTLAWTANSVGTSGSCEFS